VHYLINIAGILRLFVCLFNAPFNLELPHSVQ